MSNIFDLLYDETRNLPNKFTRFLGKLIRDARIEIKMSQKDLAEKAYLKQSSISRIEDGTRAVSTEDLLYLSIALEKPISYFFPKKFTEELSDDGSTPLEDELLMQARKLSPDDLGKLIVQARALAEFETKKNDDATIKKPPKHQEEFEKIVKTVKKKEKVSR